MRSYKPVLLLKNLNYAKLIINQATHKSSGQSVTEISLHLLCLLCLVRLKDGSNPSVDDVRQGVNDLVGLGSLQTCPPCQSVLSCKEPGYGESILKGIHHFSDWSSVSTLRWSWTVPAWFHYTWSWATGPTAVSPSLRQTALLLVFDRCTAPSKRIE